MNKNGWILSIVFGLVGVAVSSGLFFAVLYYTGVVYGLLTIALGIVSGFMAALGYRVGKGRFETARHVDTFLYVSMGFGLLGVAGGYGVMMAFAAFVGEQPLSVLEPVDAIFVALGALGGRWAGRRFLTHMVNKQTAVEMEKEGVVAKIDEKFSRQPLAQTSASTPLEAVATTQPQEPKT